MHSRPHTHPGHRNMPGDFSGRSSRNYDRLARWVLPRVYRRLAADLDPFAPAAAEVLDVGTGPGILPRELGRRRPDLRLTGLDLSADMITAAGRNLAGLGDRATAVVGDVTDLPFPDGTFDLVTTSFSLHHWDHLEVAGPELVRVLRRGGRVVVYDFPFAPFDDLAASAPFTAPVRSAVRSGIPFFRCVRLTLDG